MFKNMLTKMLNRRAESSDWRGVLGILGDLTGKTLGDIGSGGGFYALKFADAVGENGKVYAIDNDPAKLEFVEEFIRANGRNNVETVCCSGSRVPLGEGSVDLFFSRNSFHHIPKPEGYFSELKPLLKDRGRVAIIDYRKTEQLNFINLFGHCTPERTIVSAMEAAGYRHLGSYDIAEDQSFNVFGTC